MATRTITILALDAAGVPQGSLSPVFSLYLIDGSTPGTVPAISAVAGATGLYAFTLTLAAGEVVQAVVDLTASCTGQRYAAIAGNFADFFVADAVDDELTAEHGAGTWGGGAGSGAQSCTLTVQVGGQARQGARVDIFAGGSVAAQAWSAADGTATVNLDAGTYTARVTSPGATWPTTTVVVTATDTITPSTLNGTAAESTAVTPVGLTGSVSYTAPEYTGAIGPVAARDSWTVTRDISAMPANISSAKVTIRPAGAPGPSLVSPTVTVTDSTAPTGAVSIAFAADALALAGGRYAYDLEVTLADGSVRTVEVGTLTVLEHPSA